MATTDRTSLVPAPLSQREDVDVAEKIDLTKAAEALHALEDFLYALELTPDIDLGNGISLHAILAHLDEVNFQDLGIGETEDRSEATAGLVTQPVDDGGRAYFLCVRLDDALAFFSRAMREMTHPQNMSTEDVVYTAALVHELVHYYLQVTNRPEVQNIYTNEQIAYEAYSRVLIAFSQRGAPVDCFRLQQAEEYFVAPYYGRPLTMNQIWSNQSPADLINGQLVLHAAHLLVPADTQEGVDQFIELVQTSIRDVEAAKKPFQKKPSRDDSDYERNYQALLTAWGSCYEYWRLLDRKNDQFNIAFPTATSDQKRELEELYGELTQQVGSLSFSMDPLVVNILDRIEEKCEVSTR